jgi:hypothetical protein
VYLHMLIRDSNISVVKYCLQFWNAALVTYRENIHVVIADCLFLIDVLLILQVCQVLHNYGAYLL